MNDIKDIVTKPIFFERNRVYRIYHGGKPFKALFDDGYDDNYTDAKLLGRPENRHICRAFLQKTAAFLQSACDQSEILRRARRRVQSKRNGGFL